MSFAFGMRHILKNILIYTLFWLQFVLFQQSKLKASIASTDEFYHLVETSVTESFDNQFLLLKNYLKSHYDDERVYLKLLERYIAYNKLPDAYDFFHTLTTNPKFSHYSYWMLAKISMLQSDPNRAFEAFTQTLKDRLPSYLLLKDIVKFDHQYSGKLSLLNLLQKRVLTKNYQKVVSAFVSYSNIKYGQAVELFKKVPQEGSENLILLQIFGRCQYSLSYYDKADSLWRVGLKIARQRGDLYFQAQFLSNLGVLAKANEAYDNALSYYDSAYAITQRIDELYLKQLITGNRANLAKWTRDYEKSLNL
ncbi:MAG: tetratricopeptide repeat protein, partial [bacterium]